MQVLVLAALAYLFLRRPHNPTRARNPRRRRNIDAFTDARGRVHPIRESKGYSAGVEEIQQELKVEHDQAERHREMHRGLPRERGPGHVMGGVDRPPWAVGFTNAQLERIARDHGVRASQEHWWERAGLTSGSGELRMLLREGGYRLEQTRKGARSAAPQRASRPSKYAAKRKRGGGYEDLPF